MPKDKDEKDKPAEAPKVFSPASANPLPSTPISAAPSPAQTETPAESWEAQEADRKLKAYLTRNAKALARRRAILAGNGLPDDTTGVDLTVVRKRCCS